MITDEEEPTRTWIIWYISCESNRRWYEKECPASWGRLRVEESIRIGGCGDDIAEIISVEPARWWEMEEKTAC